MRHRVLSPLVFSLLTALMLAPAQAEARAPMTPLGADAFQPPEAVFKTLTRRRQHAQAMALARRTFAEATSRRRQKAWRKRFGKARKKTVRATLKQSKTAYRRLDFSQAVALSHTADRHFLTELPQVATFAKRKRRSRARRLPGARIRKAIARKLMKPVKRQLRKGNFRAAYEATARTVALFGADDPLTGGMVAAIRSRIFQNVDVYVAEKQWNQAYELLNLVAKTEPKRAAEVASRRELVTAHAELSSGAAAAAMNRASRVYEGTPTPSLKARSRSLFERAQKLATKRLIAAANDALRSAKYRHAVSLAAKADGLASIRLSGVRGTNGAALPGDVIRMAARTQLLTPARTALSQRQYEAAYVAVSAFFDVFPKDAQGVALRTSIRRTIYNESDRFMERGDFKRARRILNIVARYEPHRADEVRRRKKGIKVARAEALDRRAAALEASGDLLGAWALSRKAASLGFAPARQRARWMRDALTHRGTIGVSLTGYGKRANAYVAKLTKGIERISGAAMTTQRAAAPLSVSLDTPWPRCYDSAKVRHDRRSYSLFRQTPNPKWSRLDREIRDRRQKVERARTEAQSAKKLMDAALNKLTRCANAEGAAKGRVTRAAEVKADTQRTLDRVQKKLREISKRLKKAEIAQRRERPKAAVDVAALKAKLLKLEKRIRKLNKAIAQAERDLTAAKRVYQQERSRCRALRDAYDKRRNVQAEAGERLNRQRRQLTDLQRRFKGTPRFNKVVDKRSVSLPITRVRRTCRSVVAVTMKPRRGPSQTHQLERSLYTEDDTHRGHSEAGIAPDPLRFPSTDKALIHQADREMRPAALAMVERAIQERFSRRLKRANKAYQQGDSRRAATIWMAVWLAAPQRLPARAQRLLGDHLAQAYGLRGRLP